ncbi:hypothetical protein [Paenibacillus farraposensis]|uniref:hypothetical protein n=1 Tax=Paenibacillus farraposensis TaxID=2807095 RepID=UPI00366CE6B7
MDDLWQVCKYEIKEYIRNQLVEDKNYEQLAMKELVDSFTEESVRKLYPNFTNFIIKIKDFLSDNDKEIILSNFPFRRNI